MLANKAPSSPSCVTIRSKEHRGLAAKIVGRDSKGRPKKIELIYDEESVTVRSTDEFVLVYVREDALEKGN